MFLSVKYNENKIFGRFFSFLFVDKFNHNNSNEQITYIECGKYSKLKRRKIYFIPYTIYNSYFSELVIFERSFVKKIK